MTLPDEYKRDALGEYPEDEGASDDENDQDDGNRDASIKPTAVKPSLVIGKEKVFMIPWCLC